MTAGQDQKSLQMFDEFLKQPDAWKILDEFERTYQFGPYNDFIEPPAVERSVKYTLIAYAVCTAIGIAVGIAIGLKI